MVSTTLALRAIWGMRVCVTTFPVRFVWTSGRGCNNGSNAMRLCEGSVVYPAQSIAGNGSLRVAGVAAFGGYGYTPRGTRVRRDGKGQGRVGWFRATFATDTRHSLRFSLPQCACVLSGGVAPFAAGTSFRHYGMGWSLPPIAKSPNHGRLKFIWGGKGRNDA